MKLTVLVDNNTYIDQYYLAEPALSYLLENEKDQILFDVGYSDVFLINAQRMAIDLTKVNKLVLSHGHIDHTGGLEHITLLDEPITVYAHPLVDEEKLYQGMQVGSPIQLSALPDNFTLKLSRQPQKISPHLTFLGEIPRLFPFEGQPLGNDPLWDDSAIIYHHDQLLWVITGCSHSGICNICEYAKKISGIDHITGIIGGFHLLDAPEQTAATVSYLKDQHIAFIYPAHCTDLQAKLEIAQAVPINEVGVGLRLTIA